MKKIFAILSILLFLNACTKYNPPCQLPKGDGIWKATGSYRQELNNTSITQFNISGTMTFNDDNTVNIAYDGRPTITVPYKASLGNLILSPNALDEKNFIISDISTNSMNFVRTKLGVNSANIMEDLREEFELTK
jgi:hypothetical protein